MGVTVSEVFKNDCLIVSFRSSVQQSTRFIVWTLPTIVLLKIKEKLDIYQLHINVSKLHLCKCL